MKVTVAVRPAAGQVPSLLTFPREGRRMIKLTKSAGYATLLLALAIAACSDSPAGPTSGAMRVAVVSTGLEIDPNGYTISVDGGTNQTVASNGAVVFGGLAVGEHSVGLAGLAGNCTVSGANPQNVRVTGIDTVTAFFQVACTSTRGTLQVAATTTGTDLDVDGYLVGIQGGPTINVGPNQSLLIALPAGTYTATIFGLAPNCTLNGTATRTFTVTPGATIQLPIQVTCSATLARLRITTTTTGVDLDPKGYGVSIPNGPTLLIGPNQSILVTVPASIYSVTIYDVAANCTLNGPATRPISATLGSTTELAIQVTCSALPTILGFPFSDPAGDTLAYFSGTGPQAIDLLEITGTYKADSLIMTLRFAAPIRPSGVQAPNSLAGFLEFDTDENASTGSPPATNELGGNAPLGVEYVIILNSSDTTTVQILSTLGGGSPSRARAEYSGTSLTLRIPLASFGNDDGNFKFAGVIGTLPRPTDLLPDAGVYTARRPGTSAQMAPVRSSGAVLTRPASATHSNYVPRSWSERK